LSESKAVVKTLAPSVVRNDPAHGCIFNRFPREYSRERHAEGSEQMALSGSNNLT